MAERGGNIAVLAERRGRVGLRLGVHVRERERERPWGMIDDA